MRTLAAAAGAATLLLLAGCGSGPSSTTGKVTDVTGRLCLQTEADNGSCFAATADQLRSLVPGACVKVTYSKEQGSVPTATAVQPVASPCTSNRT